MFHLCLYKKYQSSMEVFYINIWGFCRAVLCISAAYAVMRCLPVCQCVRHVRGLCRKGYIYR